MAAEWVPYAAVVLIGIFIYGLYVCYKNRAEIFKAAGLELPEQLKQESMARRVKKEKIHPNRKKNRVKPIRNEAPKNNNNNEGVTQRKTITRESKKNEPKVIRKQRDRSDYPIDTEGQPIKIFNQNTEGLGIFTTKAGTSYMFVGQTVAMMPPIRIDLPKDTIQHVIVNYNNKRNIAFIREKIEKIFIASLSIEGEASLKLNEDVKEIDIPFKSVQCFTASTEMSPVFCLIVDSSIFKVIDIDGNVLFEEKFEGKATSIITNENFSKIFVSVGSTIHPYSFNRRKNVTPMPIMDCSGFVSGMDYREKGSFLAAVTGNGGLDIWRNAGEKKQNVNKYKLDRTAQLVTFFKGTDRLAVGFKNKLMIFDETGRILSKEFEAHEGEISILTASSDGAFLFVGSRNKPKIETFVIKADD